MFLSAPGLISSTNIGSPFVQPATPTYVGKGSPDNAIGNITPTLPASLADNDLMVLHIESATEDIGTISGWTQFSLSPNQYSTVTRCTAYYRRFVTGDAAPTITTTTDHKIGQIFAFRGCVLTGSPATMSVSQTWAGTTAFNVSCGTTTFDNQLIVILVTGGADVSTSRFVSVGVNANLTSLSQRYSESTTAGDGGSVDGWTGVRTTAGSCGNLTDTLAIASAGSAIVFALTG